MRMLVIPIQIWVTFIFAVQLVPFKAYSQGNGLMRTDLISPSPTAANLAKYGEIPVTYYTGLPNVSIPVFTVTGNELSLPITFTYNYSGHQPMQKASWVGLGWSLNAGGVITRTIRDKVETSMQGYDKVSASNVSPTQNYLKQSYESVAFDNLPDIYSFNFGNYSGKFLCYNGTAYVMPDQKLKVTAGGGGFIITTEDGTKYEFTETEQTTLRPGAGSFYNVPTHNSSWYLTRITNAAGTESIRLYYADDGRVLQFGPRVQSYNKLNSSNGLSGYNVPTTDFPGSPSDVFPTKVGTKRLSSIVSDKFIVHFDADLVREDIETDAGVSKALTKIRVLSNDGLTVKQVSFDYGYFGGGCTHCKYLKLKSITENGSASGGKLMTHSFVYYNENEGFGSGVSSNVDKFGYLRGPGTLGYMYISDEIYPSGVNRNPVFGAAVNGALKKVIYPTGGNTTFTYEANRYNNGNGYIINNGGASVSEYPTNHFWAVDTFKIYTAQDVEVTFMRSTGDTLANNVNPGSLPEVRIFPVYRLLDDEGNFENETVGSAIYEGKILFNEYNGGVTEVVNLEPGKYILRAYIDPNEDGVHGSVAYKIHTDIPDPGDVGPGIRLKSLTHDNGYGKTLSKEFLYVDANGFSSCELLRSDVYDTRAFTNIYIYGGEVWRNEFTTYTSALAETPGLGLPFYNKRVVEKTISSTGEVHQSDYEYQYFEGTKQTELVKQTDYEQLGQTFVPVSQIEKTFSVDFYSDNFGGMDIYVKAAHISYYYQELPPVYEYDFISNMESVVWKHPVLTKQTEYENGQAKTVETRSYYDVNGTRNLTATKTTLSDGTILYTRYKYPEDYAGNTALSEMVSDNMVSPVIEEQVWRKDPSGGSVMISGRVNEYAGKRLKAIYVLESAGGINALNAENKNSSGLFTTLLSDTRYKKKIEFTYDASGRVVKQQLTDHSPVSYLWAYPALTGSGSAVRGNTYPVAEIKNASPDSVFYTSFEDVTGVLDAFFTGYKAKPDSFKIKRTFQGTYTLTYWKKTTDNPWQLITETLTDPSDYIIQAAGSYIDEVRLYPAGAQLTTYAYSPGVGLRHINDANNKITLYEYDQMGRLQTIKDHNGNLLNTYQYHVKDQILPPAAE